MPGSTNGPDFFKQRETLECLPDAMEQTQSLYDSAKEEFERVKRCKSVGSDEKLMRDMRIKEFLFQIYQRALMDFMQYVLEGAPLEVAKMSATHP